MMSIETHRLHDDQSVQSLKHTAHPADAPTGRNLEAMLQHEQHWLQAVAV